MAVNVEEKEIFRKLNRLPSGHSKMLHTYDPKQLSTKAFAKPDSVPYTLVVRADGSIAKTMAGWCEDGCLEVIFKQVNGALAAARAARATGG